jgi:DNA-binding HxlR family transcriptional regulator
LTEIAFTATRMSRPFGSRLAVSKSNNAFVSSTEVAFLVGDGFHVHRLHLKTFVSLSCWRLFGKYRKFGDMIPVWILWKSPMKRRNFAHRPACAVEATLDLIDGKWKGVILFHLQGGTQRFGELRNRIHGITQRMLTKQLRALEDDNLVIRKVYAEVPPRVEYRLSQIGESLRPVIDTLRAWGENHRASLSRGPESEIVKAPDRAADVR